MTVAAAIAERLLELSAVTALVGTRVRVMKLRQSDTLPAIRVDEISGIDDLHERGAVGVIKSRVQVDSYADTASGVDPYAVASAVDAALHGDGAGSGLNAWRGSVGSPPFQIDVIRDLGVTRTLEKEGSREIVRVIREYMVTHRG